MLSVNFITKFLSEDQENIDQIFYKKLKNYEKNKNIVEEKENKEEENKNTESFSIQTVKKYSNLSDSFEIIFNKSLKDFYYNNKISKNKSPIFTFIYSIMMVENETFSLYDEVEKEKTIKELIKKMDNELFEQNLYYKFNYTKNRRFNKSDIQMVLKNGYYFKHCEKINLLKEYLSDYLGINIYIFEKKNDIFDMENSELYLSKRYNENLEKSLPNFFLIKENEIYKPILFTNNNNESIIKYSLYKDIIDNIWKIFNIVDNNKKDEINIEKEDTKKENEIKNIKIKYEYNDIKNFKVDELKKLCIENNIELQKPSEKTGKLINKLKCDLINDLLKI